VTIFSESLDAALEDRAHGQTIAKHNIGFGAVGGQS
jgi:hypothetical protein